MKKAVILILLGLIPMTLFAQTAEEIINEMDNRQGFDTSFIKGEMITVDQFGEKRSTFQSWARGSSDVLIEMLGESESGQKILRLGDELYLYYPDAEEVIPMYGSALKQSMFGDISYEDMTEGNNSLDKYKVSMAGSERIDGRDCWIINMEAKKRNVPYPRQKVWVTKDEYLLQKAEYFSKSGKLLKEMLVLEVKMIAGQNSITHMKLTDKLKRKSSTEMIVSEIQTNLPIDDDLFTVAGLSW